MTSPEKVFEILISKKKIPKDICNEIINYYNRYSDGFSVFINGINENFEGYENRTCYSFPFNWQGRGFYCEEYEIYKLKRNVILFKYEILQLENFINKIKNNKINITKNKNGYITNLLKLLKLLKINILKYNEIIYSYPYYDLTEIIQNEVNNKIIRKNINIINNYDNIMKNKIKEIDYKLNKIINYFKTNNEMKYFQKYNLTFSEKNITHSIEENNYYENLNYNRDFIIFSEKNDYDTLKFLVIYFIMNNPEKCFLTQEYKFY